MTAIVSHCALLQLKLYWLQILIIDELPLLSIVILDVLFNHSFLIFSLFLAKNPFFLNLIVTLEK